MTPKLSPDLTSGFDPLDSQHQPLLDRLDAAIASARAGDVAGTRQALATLSDFLIAHFAAEELFMAEAAYPERAPHKTAHDLFIQDFMSLTRELDAGDLTPRLVHWISERVPGWLKFHIQVNDVPLGRYLARQRLRSDARPARDKTGPS